MTLSARTITEEGIRRHLMQKSDAYGSPNAIAVTLNELKMKNKKPNEIFYSHMVKKGAHRGAE